MLSDYQIYASARMADYERMAIAADLVRQAKAPVDDEATPHIGWTARLMMSLGFRTPTLEYIGHARV